MTINVAWMQALEEDPAIVYTARAFRQIIEAAHPEGVLRRLGTEVLASERGAGANWSVDVSPGTAFIYGDDEADQGAYQVESTAVENVTGFDPAPGLGTRIDLVVWRVRDPQAGGDAGYDAIFEVVPGVVGDPAPDAPDSALAVAEVEISAGMTSIEDAVITNVAPDSSFVGRLRDAPAQTFSQWGNYTGDGTNPGTFDLPFTPSLVMINRVSALNDTDPHFFISGLGTDSDSGEGVRLLSVAFPGSVLQVVAGGNIQLFPNGFYAYGDANLSGINYRYLALR